MKDNILNHIKKLVEKKKIDEAELELSKLGATFYKNSEYLYLRGEIFFIKKL